MAITLWVLVYCVAASASIALLGDRALLSGDLFSPRGLLTLVTHWRFLAAMGLALMARLAFTMVNSQLLLVPRLEKGATTITAFVTAISFLAVVGANAVFLGERLTAQQAVGAVLVIVGIGVLSA